MDFGEFDQLARRLREEAAAAARMAPGFSLMEGRTASAEDIAEAEHALGVALPQKYKTFMRRYGGGTFGFADLLPVRARGSGGDSDDIVSVSRRRFPDGSFVAVAPVGTGDFWVFPVSAGRCREEVWLHVRDGGDPAPEDADFLDFLARVGVRP